MSGRGTKKKGSTSAPSASKRVKRSPSKAACPAGGAAAAAARAKDTGTATPCMWGTETKDPHIHEPFTMEMPKICDTILDHIGRTPLVRLNRIPKAEGVRCEVLVKCEYFNAGGSVKDRIGRRMVIDAEKSGRLKPGDTLIEPTSGNTGIGLALAAAIKGYPMIITLPEKMSKEKVDVLKALGAQIYRTPTEAAFDSPESHIGVANRLNREIPNSHILDQYANPSNPLAHYDGTAEELLFQCDGKIDVAVISAGTGGTISGIARKLKERIPNIQIVGVDPKGSILAQPESLNGAVTSYQVEGIGYDFIPRVLDRGVVDHWIKTEDKESFLMSRRLIHDEGLLCGGSSGSAVAAAMRYAKNLPANKRVVVVLPDSVRNYMTKFLDPNWMVQNKFMAEEKKAEGTVEQWLSRRCVADLPMTTPITVLPDVTCSQCVRLCHENGFDQVPVVSANGAILGMVGIGNLQSKLVSGRVRPNDPVSLATYTRFQRVSLQTSLYELHRIFERDHFVLVTTTQKSVGGPTVVQKTVIIGVLARVDLLNYILAKNPGASSSNGGSVVASSSS